MLVLKCMQSMQTKDFNMLKMAFCQIKQKKRAHAADEMISLIEQGPLEWNQSISLVVIQIIGCPNTFYLTNYTKDRKFCKKHLI